MDRQIKIHILKFSAKKFILIISVLAIFPFTVAITRLTFAANPGVDLPSYSTNSWVTKIGNPTCNNLPSGVTKGDQVTGISPKSAADCPGNSCADNSNGNLTCYKVNTSSNSAVTGDASCPVKNGVIVCSSLGPPVPWSRNPGYCGVDANGNVGHCNLGYGGTNSGFCTQQYGLFGWNSHAIDVIPGGAGAVGAPVYLPTINGQSLTWEYWGNTPNISSGDTGFIRIFRSKPQPDGTYYTLEFLHVDGATPSLPDPNNLHSGDQVATIYNMSGAHAHIVIGTNIPASASQVMRDSPNWHYTDREFKMCTGG